MEPRVQLFPPTNSSSPLLPNSLKVPRPLHWLRTPTATHLQSPLEHRLAGIEGQGPVRSFCEDRPIKAEDTLHDKDYKVSFSGIYTLFPILRSDLKICPPFPPHPFDRRFCGVARGSYDRLTTCFVLGFTCRSSTSRDITCSNVSRCPRTPGSDLGITTRDPEVHRRRKRARVTIKRKKSSSTPVHH